MNKGNIEGYQLYPHLDETVKLLIKAVNELKDASSSGGGLEEGTVGITPELAQWVHEYVNQDPSSLVQLNIGYLDSTIRQINDRVISLDEELIRDVQRMSQLIESLTSNLSSEIQSTDEDVALLNSKLATSESKITALENANTSLTSKLATSESKITALENANTSLTSKLATSESKITALENANTSQQTTIDDLVSRVSSLETPSE